MTEEYYQQCRKVMQQINHLRGLITSAKRDVSKWTKIEDVHRRDGRIYQADGANKILEKQIIRLNELRQKFEQMKFPDISQMHKQINQ